MNKKEYGNCLKSSNIYSEEWLTVLKFAQMLISSKCETFKHLACTNSSYKTMEDRETEKKMKIL